ncbi:MAG: glycosyltransferase family 4 protein [Bacteroidota bacterium]
MAEKKVCILSLGRRGGSVRYATAIIDQLERPYDVYVSKFCTEPRPQKAKTILTYRNSFEFVLVSLFWLPIFWFTLVGKLIRGRYTALYLPYTHYWNILFIQTFRLFGLKTVATIHDGIPHSGDGNFWERYSNRFSVRKAGHLVFLTQFVHDLVQEKIGFKAQASVIPHGLLHPKGINFNLRSFPEKAKLLFFGRVGHYKGVDLLIEAIQQVDPNLFEELIIAGDHLSSVNFKADYPKVTWIKKWLSEAEMVDLINQSDVLVLPYREATQSGVITIGISAALPMICTRSGGIPEQLNEDEALFVEPDPKSIQNGIENLLKSPELYARMVKKLAQKRENSDWRQIAASISKLLG